MWLVTLVITPLTMVISLLSAGLWDQGFIPTPVIPFSILLIVV